MRLTAFRDNWRILRRNYFRWRKSNEIRNSLGLSSWRWFDGEWKKWSVEVHRHRALIWRNKSTLRELVAEDRETLLAHSPSGEFTVIMENFSQQSSAREMRRRWLFSFLLHFTAELRSRLRNRVSAVSAHIFFNKSCGALKTFIIADSSDFGRKSRASNHEFQSSICEVSAHTTPSNFFVCTTKSKPSDAT